MPEKIHEKIQPLSSFFRLQLYYRIKNNKNLNLERYNKYFFYRVIFQASHILHGRFQ